MNPDLDPSVQQRVWEANNNIVVQRNEKTEPYKFYKLPYVGKSSVALKKILEKIDIIIKIAFGSVDKCLKRYHYFQSEGSDSYKKEVVCSM